MVFSSQAHFLELLCCCERGIKNSTLINEQEWRKERRFKGLNDVVWCERWSSWRDESGPSSDSSRPARGAPLSRQPIRGPRPLWRASWRSPLLRRAAAWAGPRAVSSPLCSPPPPRSPQAPPANGALLLANLISFVCSYMGKVKILDRVDV